MSRIFLLWSLLLGLALAGADWYVDRGHVSRERQMLPSYEGGTPINTAGAPDHSKAITMEGGTPFPGLPK